MLRQLPTVADPNLLVGADTADDAAVYRIDDNLALVQTVDFFPPIVDDPTSFGEIAVANALSDVYAMGGKPLMALNIVAFPANLPSDILVAVLKGGADKAREAGVLIVGGHTVDDAEPKYGLAVTGIVKPGTQVTNTGAMPGDILVLTKPLGTGIITTAGKQDLVNNEVLSEAVDSMKVLNRSASEAMMTVGVNACTDITGFGLLGHLRGIVDNSGVGARLNFRYIPLLPYVIELAESGVAPGGTHRNLDALEGVISWDPELPKGVPVLLADAQTSGGLLISVRPDRLKALLTELESARVSTRAVVGEIVDRSALGEGISISVAP